MEREAKPDRAWLAEAYRAHAPVLFRFILRWCHDEDLAGELVQETFVRAVSTEFRCDSTEASAVSAWLSVTARRLLISEWRRRERRRTDLMDTQGLDEALDCGRLEAGWNADEALDVRRAERSLRMAVEKLPEQMRQVIVATYFEGLKTKEVASVLGISSSAVGTAALRARHRLREVLSKDLSLEAYVKMGRGKK